MSTTEKTTVETPKVQCDGGGGALGHPKVYLTIDQTGSVDCPYCGRKFILKSQSNK